MRYRNIALMAAATGLVAVGFAAPSQAALTTLCDGTASDVTVPGDLIVPAGKDCELINVVINGNTTVRADADLLLDGSTVNGNVRIMAGGFADVIETTVTGTTTVTDGFGFFAENSTLTGNVTGQTPGWIYTIGTQHGKNFSSTNGETFIESGRVTGGVTTNGDVLTDVFDSVIKGSLSVTGTTEGSLLCLSEVDGNATFTGNSEILQVGASAPLDDCGFNVFHANVNITDNTAASYFSDNVVRGNLTCSGNDPAPVVENNRVRGTVDCESGEAAVAARRAFASADERKAEVLAAIEARSAEAEAAAEDAGPAFQ